MLCSPRQQLLLQKASLILRDVQLPQHNFSKQNCQNKSKMLDQVVCMDAVNRGGCKNVREGVTE